jgi:hypothetical protein
VAFGNAYIFNLYSEPADVSMNGQGSAGRIAAPSPSSTPPYTPSQIVVPRTNLTQDQLWGQTVLCQGQNDISINYGGQQWRVSVTIPPPPSPPLEQDLWLYLAYQQAFLFTSYGALINAPGDRLGFPMTKVG